MTAAPEEVWGLDALFPVDEDGPAIRAAAPWPQATRLKDRHNFDADIVAQRARKTPAPGARRLPATSANEVSFHSRPVP